MGVAIGGKSHLDIWRSALPGRLFSKLGGWAVEGVSLHPARFVGSVTSIGIGRSRVTELRISSECLVRFRVPARRSGIVLCRGVEDAGITGNGFDFDADSIWVGRSGAELISSIPGNTSVLAISWPDSTESDVALSGTLGRSSEVEALRAAITPLFEARPERSFAVVSSQRENLAEKLELAMIGALKSTRSDRMNRHAPAAKFEQFRLAFNALIEQPDTGNLTSREIADRASIGLRALQLAFRACCNVSPVRLSRLIHLQRIHDTLTHSTDRSEALADIAKRNGFSSPSHLASAYRSVYGVPPSDTRRRAVEEHSAGNRP